MYERKQQGSYLRLGESSGCQASMTPSEEREIKLDEREPTLCGSKKNSVMWAERAGAQISHQRSPRLPYLRAAWVLGPHLLLSGSRAVNGLRSIGVRTPDPYGAAMKHCNLGAFKQQRFIVLLLCTPEVQNQHQLGHSHDVSWTHPLEKLQGNNLFLAFSRCWHLNEPCLNLRERERSPSGSTLGCHMI